jgi:hypothetical protein
VFRGEDQINKLMKSGFYSPLRKWILAAEAKRQPPSSYPIAMLAFVATIVCGFTQGSVSAENSFPDPSVATQTPRLPSTGIDQMPASEGQSTRNETVESLLRAAAIEYILSGGSASLDRELALYEKYVVDYYDQGPKSDDEIRADITQLRRRWPSRVYQVRRVVSTEYDSKEDIGTVVVQYTYEVSNGVKRKTGQMETFLVFGTVSKQPRVILVSEHNVR